MSDYVWLGPAAQGVALLQVASSHALELSLHLRPLRIVRPERLTLPLKATPLLEVVER